MKGTGKKQLVVAPLQGRGTKGPNWGAGEGVRVLVYDVPEKPESEHWPVEIAESSLHTIHNLQLVDMDGDRRDESRGRVLGRRLRARPRLSRALDQDAHRHRQPGRSTVQRVERGQGRPASRGRTLHRHDRALAWLSGRRLHERSETASAPTSGLWSRQVIAEPLQWGHAVWTANLDDDGDDELIIGQRDPNKPGTAGPRGPGVFVFDPKPGSNPLAFERHTIDDGGMACEDALAADLDGDGRADIVAGGRATHNVKIYWNRQK